MRKRGAETIIPPPTTTATPNNNNSNNNNNNNNQPKVLDPVHRTLALPDLKNVVLDKIEYILHILQSTVYSLQRYKSLEIFSHIDLLYTIAQLCDLFQQTARLNAVVTNDIHDADALGPIVDELQQTLDKLASTICTYGTHRLEDLFFVTFGSSFLRETEFVDASPVFQSKRQLILNCLRPVGYKTIHWKKTRPYKDVVPMNPCCCLAKRSDHFLVPEQAPFFECFDIDPTTKSFYARVHGVKLVVHHEKSQRTLVITCLVDEVVVDCLHDAYLLERKRLLVHECLLDRIVQASALKDFLVYSTSDFTVFQRAVLSQCAAVHTDHIDHTIKRFLDLPLYDQRQWLLQLLLHADAASPEVQYTALVLYDLLKQNSNNSSNATSNNSSSSKMTLLQVDSPDQHQVYDSLPWRIKLLFKDALKQTTKINKDILAKSDTPKISIEQQIVLLKAPDNVKEKAVQKLKEIKGRNDDGGSKAKQYLEGLLRIPFGHLREEPLLRYVDEVRTLFAALDEGQGYRDNMCALDVHLALQQRFRSLHTMDCAAMVSPHLGKYTTKQLQDLVWLTSSSMKSKEARIRHILETLNDVATPLTTKLKIVDRVLGTTYEKTLSRYQEVEVALQRLPQSLQDIQSTLDDAVHGHQHAKSQILKIIGQWMNGESSSGYCFGFEGCPGVGKTSLAKKGLAQCLLNADGEPRPFAFIALGGSANGATLEGHSYTYVNSAWGRIADILMDTKCMNPIIYIDELDKVSKTEHGKEIVGILTHLIDATQNDVFQDKYFSGIDLDLSKALFIFSYNDPSQIDRILLDRIHRVSFEPLSLEDKCVIVRDYLVPDLQKKLGWHEDIVVLEDATIQYLVESYTYESGVRKLKEVLFDLFGEINLALLRCDKDLVLPLVLTPALVQSKYLTTYDRIKRRKIDADKGKEIVGVMHGLWASMYGKGGVLPIQTTFVPGSSSHFLELKLTGSQGDVMKESMTVAKTVAWRHLSPEQQARVEKEHEHHGVHIHCPDGATPKDGPSAGTGIALALYSLWLDKPLPVHVAITGEINLQGEVTEIGGLEAKWLGGIDAGITQFLYPCRNQDDADKFFAKYPALRDKYTFTPVATFVEALTALDMV